MKITIAPSPRTTIAENKDSARRARLEKIMPALEHDERVVLDFRRVEVATQSYVHALISDAISRRGAAALDLIEFKNCSPAVREIVNTVVEYTLLARRQAGVTNGHAPTG